MILSTRRGALYSGGQFSTLIYTTENRRGFTPSIPDIVAATSLGFWRELSKPRYAADIWQKGRLGLTFPHILAGKDLRKDLEVIHGRVDGLVKLRNRIAHHEPIIHSKGSMRGGSLRERHSEMLELLRWMDPNFSLWVESHDNFAVIIEECPLKD